MHESYGYTLKRISPEALEDFRYIHIHAFGFEPDMKKIRQKFDTAYCGCSFLGHIAYSSLGQPAAFYGLFPTFLSWMGQRKLGAQSGDVMTHPDHQRKGLFMLTAQASITLAREVGIEFLFASPNQSSQPGFEKQGWQQAYRLHQFTQQVSRSPITRIKSKFFPEQVEKQRHNYLAKVTTASLDSIQLTPESHPFPFQVYKDTDYLAHKKYGGSYWLDLPDAFVWCKTRHNWLWVGDVLFKTSDPIRRQKVWNVLETIVARLGLFGLEFLIPEKEATYYALPASYSRQVANSLVYLDLAGEYSSIPLTVLGSDIDTF